MTVTQEELAAYADGELEGEEAARVVLAVVASPDLMRVVQGHRVLRKRIRAEFAPILDQEMPERLAALLRAPGEEMERHFRSKPQEEDRRPEDDTKHLPVTVTHPPSGARVNEIAGADRRLLRHRGWFFLPVLAAALAVAATFPADRVREPNLILAADEH